MLISKSVFTTRFWNKVVSYTCGQKIGKTSNIKVVSYTVVKRLERQVILKSVGVSSPKGLNMIPKICGG